MGERIAKYISNRGYCSRRKAEQLISSGLVAINNIVVKELSTQIQTTDSLTIKGLKLDNKLPTTRLWLYNKPLGVITSHSDPQGRLTVFNALYPLIGYVISIGRLDINSTGLLLITNNPKLARYYELPSSNISRVYHVRAYGIITREKLHSMQEEQLVIDGIRYQQIKIKLTKENNLNNCFDNSKKNIWFEITLNEGKNREIRKILNFFDLLVNRLIRVEFGDFKLEQLGIGKIKEISAKIIQSIMAKEVLS